MKRMYRIALFALLGTAAFAQTEAPQAEKVPAELEQTVRSRVDEFYSRMLKGQYRQAEAFIAEDTKDYYYAGAKPEIHKYELISVEFSDLTHAKALAKVTEPVTMAGFPPSEMTVTVPSLWRLEDGKWLLYEDPDKIKNPSGLQSKIQDAVKGAASATGAGTPSGMPSEIPKDPSFAMGKVLANKAEVKLVSGGSDTVVIANSSQGPFTLEPGAQLPGIEAKLDKTELGRGEKAILTLTASKEAKAGGFYYLRVMPTGEPIRINVKVQ